LQHGILLRDELAMQVVIRTTESFNLHCNNVARQVEEKCSAYYRTLKGSLKESHGGNADVAKQKFNEHAEQGLCTCSLIRGTFLCRPLQNNNVK